MIQLKDYIEQNNTLYNDIYDELVNINHLNVSLSLDQFILEKNGEYDGCYELCEFIFKAMKEHNNDNHLEKYTLVFQKDELKEIDNIFFKEIFINVNIDKSNKENYAKYEIWQSNIKNYDAFKYDENEHLFNFVSINIELIENTIVKSNILSHELNHAFEDYNRYKGKSAKLYNYIEDYGYLQIVDNIKYKNMNKYEQFINVLLYVLSEHEQNAFISQLVNIIKQKSSSFHSIKELYQHIYNKDEQFSSFIKIYNNYKYYINNENEWNKICKCYNQLNNTNYTNHKIYSILSDKVYKFRKKLIKHIHNTYRLSKSI